MYTQTKIFSVFYPQLIHFSGFLFYLIFQLFAFFHLVVIYYIIHILTLGGSLIVVLMKIGTIKLNQMDTFVSKIDAHQFSSFQLFYFLQHNNMSLKMFSHYNFLYGKTFLVFLVCGLPVNTLLTTKLLFFPLPINLQIIFVVIICMQQNYLFIMHYWSIMAGIQLHKPAKRFFKIQILSKKLKNVLVRLKLSRYIEQFVNKNTYSIQYGKYGKITFGSFIKVIKIVFKFYNYFNIFSNSFYSTI